MADEQLATETSPPPSDLKRKLDEPQTNPNENALTDPDLVTEPDESDPKRPRLDESATVNGHQEEKMDEPKEEADGEPTEEKNTLLEETQQPADEATELGNDEKSVVESQQIGDTREPADEKPQLENPQEELSKGEVKEPSLQPQESLAEVVPQQGDISSAEQPTSEAQTVTRRLEIPPTKVGVLIGKGGDTIRFLQYNSGAKIQITRDVESDPNAPTRPVEIIGILENVIKAEKLIKEVIAEADAGGSPSLVARGLNTYQSHKSGEQIEIQVPNEKVGSIIGKGGENIKNLQTRSGARIQLIPQHLSEGDQSRERTVRISGDKKQIEVAKEMIKEVMNQPPRRRDPHSGGYNQQGFRPRGPPGSQWGPRGNNQSRQSGYNNSQRGPHPSHNQQYQSSSYGNNYPPQQQAPPRGNFGWDQRQPQSTMQAPPPQGGYDYYGGPNNVPGPQQHHPHGPPAHVMGPPPSHNYGQQHGQDYGQQTQYSQNAPPQQNYGHGYPETKYENQAPQQVPYGGPQPSAYPQGTPQQGYGTQDQYGKPQPYGGVAPQGPHAQPYSQPRATQPGEMPYAGQAQNAPAQQTYPYAASGPAQQAYPQHGADGYAVQQPGAVSGPTGYAQQTGQQPVQGYGQPVQQAPVYAQVGPAGNYGPQPGYTEQAAPNNPGYGYQGPTDPAAYAAAGPGPAYVAPAGQPVYSQPPQAQPQPQPQAGYDQSVQQPGAYGNVPAAYVQGAHYDPNQMYAAQAQR